MNVRGRFSDGTPIEQAPLWVPVLFAVLLWLICFPAVVGLLHGFGLWHGDRLQPALGAAGLALALTIGLAARRPWRRPRLGDPSDSRPRFIRLVTWLITSLLYPNVLMGSILLMRPGPPPDRASTIALGLLLSTLQALFAWLGDRRRAAELRANARSQPGDLP